MSRFKLSKKQKEKIANSLVVSILFLFIVAIITHFYLDDKKVKAHLEECRKICHPGEMIENLSFDKCVCRKLEISEEETF